MLEGMIERREYSKDGKKVTCSRMTECSPADMFKSMGGKGATVELEQELT